MNQEPRQHKREAIVAKKKVFISFDFDNDKTLKEFIIGQAKHEDSPFEVADHSLKEAAPEKDWLDKATAAIKRSDVFIIMLGPKTKTAPGVLKEVKVAKDLNKSRFQLIGYKDGSADLAVPDGGRTYSWNWENLKKLLA
jgi:Thoeris protein ThsB, TIR-like domain